VSSAAWELARRQHAVVSRRQLLELGLTPRAIEHRIAKGRLHRVHRGVYAVGRPGLTRHGRWSAALLACGDRAVLSHESAAQLWGIRDMDKQIEISVPLGRDPRPRGIRVHRRALEGRELACRDGIAVTAVVRTFLDLAARLSSNALEAAINQADKVDLIDPETLREALGEQRGKTGVRPLRRVLDRRTFTLTDSELERRFAPIARRAGLPAPRTQQWVNGFRVDFHWPALGLVVETDGLRYHRTAAQQAADRVRDQAHAAAGLVPLRFTRAQVVHDPAHVEATLRAVVARLRRRGHNGSQATDREPEAGGW
jgi:very-short-patch-repair endonuclease